MLFIWFSLALWIKYKNIDKNLTTSEYNLFLATIYLYPFLETVLKYMITEDVIPYSWSLLNRIEHFSWSFATGILIYPLLKPVLHKLSLLPALLYFVGIITMIGNCNEFFEFLVRYIENHLSDPARQAIYYWDTIFDLGINILGAAASFSLLQRFRKKKILVN